MIRKNQRFLNMMNVISDGMIVLCAYLFSSWFWLDTLQGSENMAEVRSLREGAGSIAGLYALVMVALLAVLRVYNTTRVRGGQRELVSIWEANTLGVLGVASLLYAFRLQEFSRGVLGIFFLSSGGCLSCKRVLLWHFLKKMREKGYNQKHVLVVGTGRLAKQFANDVAATKSLGVQIDGFFGVKPAEDMNRYSGGFDSLEKALEDTGIDEVVVALEPHETQYVKESIGLCEKSGTKVSVIPFYNDIIPSHPAIEIIGKSKLINLRSNPLDNLGYAAFKRFFDIVASAALLVAFSPLMLIAAVGTRISSPGSVFFKQERVGRGKKYFQMYKFRSMRVNAKQDTAWTTDDDPRKTKFGSFLRKFSIDELPQLLNVLRGDMSLVGPRPEIPFFVEQFKETIPLYMVKHQVRPGMTGWAQVNGYRGDTSIVKRIEYDVWYIEHWSIGLDLKILWMTLWGGWMNRESLPQ